MHKLWKIAAKYWYSQFLIWRDAYNEVVEMPLSFSRGNAVSFYFTNKDE